MGCVESDANLQSSATIVAAGNRLPVLFNSVNQILQCRLHRWREAGRVRVVFAAKQVSRSELVCGALRVWRVDIGVNFNLNAIVESVNSDDAV